jgi:outer membrane protein OmpA-like peptidoglycan-associated protein
MTYIDNYIFKQIRNHIVISRPILLSKQNYLFVLLLGISFIPVCAQSTQTMGTPERRISCSYFNYEVIGAGYLYNHSWNDYIRGYNAAVVPPAGITHYRWGRPFVIEDLMFSWGYARYGSSHHITINASLGVLAGSLYGKHLGRDEHLTSGQYDDTNINYSYVGLGLGYLHTPKGYESKSEFVTYGFMVSATSNSFEITYRDSLDQSSNGIFSTKVRTFLNYNFGGDTKSASLGTIGLYAEYSLPNRIYTNLYNQYLPYTGAPSRIYVNPASIGVLFSYSLFPQKRQAGRSAQHYVHGNSYTPQVHNSTITVRNYNYEIKGQITDSVSGKPVGKALITFSGHSFRQPIKLNSNATGNYDMRVHILEANNYTWQVMTTGYMPYTSTDYIGNIPSEGVDTIIKNIILVPYKKGDIVPLDNITFAKGTSQLSDKSIPEMDNVVAFLDMNPFMAIQINGYTSSENIDAKSNIKLSLDRAKAIRKYLVSNGIRRNRVKVQGYGSSRPVVSNDSEQHREENRRVEFVILKI